MASILLAPNQFAQSKNGPFLAGTIRTQSGTPGGLLSIDPTAPTSSTIAPFTGVNDNPACLAMDPQFTDRIFIGTFGRDANGDAGPCQIRNVIYQGNSLVGSQVLNSNPLDEDVILALAVIGDKIYYLGRNNLGVLPVHGGEGKPVLNLTNLGNPRAMATDGKHLFLALDPQEVVIWDLSNPGSLTPLGKISAQQGEQITNLAIGNDGDLLLTTASPSLGGRLLKMDSNRGTILQTLTLPLKGARAVAQDPETGNILVAGGVSNTQSAFLTIKDWKVSQGPYGHLANAVPTILVQKRRLGHFSGHGCPDSKGQVPSIDFTGPTNRGTKDFHLTLQTSPLFSCVAIIGVHDSSRNNPWPFDMTVMGAPGCLLGVQPLILLHYTADANGVVDVIMPPPPTSSIESGIISDVQWAVLDKQANALGLVTSPVLSIVVLE